MSGRPEDHVPRRLWTRRRVLCTAVGTLASGTIGAIGTGAYAWRIEPHWVQVTRRDLPIVGLPRAMDGAQLVQLSDLHIGPIVDSSYLARALSLVNGLRPDMLVITGDIVHRGASPAVAEVEALLGTLQHGRYGAYAILGNHDYGRDWADQRVAGQVVEAMEAAGLTVLRNEMVNVHGVRLVGLDDLWGPNFRPARVMSVYERPDPVLTLCHNPDAADTTGLSGCRGWTLCGHTHGGQCRFPFIGAPILPVQNKSYVEGVIQRDDDRWLYINRGVGYLRRVRFFVRPEITCFTLHRADSPQSIARAAARVHALHGSHVVRFG